MTHINYTRISSVILGLLSTILCSSCFLVCNTSGVTIPQEEILCSNNIGEELLCQIGIEGNRFSKDQVQYTLWQCMRGDSIMSINKKNVVVRYKGIENSIKTLRVQDTSKWRKWWKKYWTKENVDWRKVSQYDFSGYAFMKIDFESNVELGDSLQIIERDFPQKGDSVVISIKLPLSSKFESARYHYNNIDADSQFARMKNEIEQRRNRVNFISTKAAEPSAR